MGLAVALTFVGCGTETQQEQPPPRWLINGTEPVGEPCTAPPKGESDAKGYAFGVNFDTSLQANFAAHESVFVIHFASNITFAGACEIQSPEMYLRIIFDRADAKIGKPIDVPADVFVAFENFPTDGPLPGQIIATYGTLLLNGYDPRSHSLCGSIDVLFNDDEGGHVSGSFQAPIQCPDPGFTE